MLVTEHCTSVTAKGRNVHIPVRLWVPLPGLGHSDLLDEFTALSLMVPLFITLYTVHFDIPAPHHLTLGISSSSESCTLSVIPR